MRIHVVIPDDVIAEVDQLVGPRGRSKFFTDAASDMLRRYQLLHAIDVLADALAEQSPPEWATTESAAEWVHRGRQLEIDRLDEWADISSTHQP
jgi:hypothetical protein